MRKLLFALGRTYQGLAFLLLVASCGGSGGEGGGDGGSPNPNMMFVTSTTTNGNMGGLAGADAICTARAAAAGLSGTYVAWLSTTTVNAKDRLGSARGWVRRDGLPFADTVADLVAGKIFYPPRIDETGADVGANATVFTGTKPDGTAASATCSDWKSSAVPIDGTSGLASAGGAAWTQRALDCLSSRLYCFGVNQIVPLTFSPAAGRLAFLSAGTLAANSGIAAADTLCQTEADGAGQPGTYKAVLATTTASAASRFSTAGATWVRRDGVRAFASAADLGTSNLMAPIYVSASGSYLPGSIVWMGAASFSAVGTAATTCNDWSNNTTGTAATASGDSSGNPLTGLGQPCSTPHRLYCLQQ